MKNNFKDKMVLKESENNESAPKPIEPKLLLMYLLDIIKYDFSKLDMSDYNSIFTVESEVMKKIKYIIGGKEHDSLRGYVHEFIRLNIELLRNGDKDIQNYELPKYKKFKIEGNETYTARKSDYYAEEQEGFSSVEMEYMYNEGELYIYDAKFQSDEVYDTWDTDLNIDNIEVIQVVENFKRISGLIK
jgi:hypothetical protein